MTNYEKAKDIATSLETAANKSYHVEREPATRKQIWYLANLMAEANDTSYITGSLILSKRKASEIIQDFLTPLA